MVQRVEESAGSAGGADDRHTSGNGRVDRTLEESQRVREVADRVAADIRRTLTESRHRTAKIRKTLRKAGYPV